MSERLELLRPVLSKYQRRFTVLDLGAGINNPTLGYEIAQVFDAVVVEVEKDWKPVPTRPRTIVLRHEFSVADLQRLSECCHFDVVLAFNLIHWFGAEWQAASDAILSMGDYVFVQTPVEADSLNVPGYPYIPQMQSYFKEQGEWLGSTSQFPAHPPRPIYLHKNGVKQITRTNWDAHAESANIKVYSTHYDVKASFHHKTPREFKDWIPGINLWNFCKLGGVVPARERLVEMLHAVPLPEKPHGDIQPWNMILDGERLHLIDGGDGWTDGAPDAVELENTIRKVEACLSL